MVDLVMALRKNVQLDVKLFICLAGYWIHDRVFAPGVTTQDALCCQITPFEWSPNL